MLHLRFAVRHQRTWLYLMVAAAFCALALTGTPPRVSGASVARHADDVQAAPANHVPQIPVGFAYRQTNLASDVPGLALIEDPLLVNPWGISLSATGPFWISNSGRSTSSLYRGDANGVVFFKQPYLPSITIPDGSPTGSVANPAANEFVLPGTCAAAPCGANVIFATLTGNIVGWNPNAPAAGSTTGVIAASQPKGYTGLAIGNNGSGNFLYAAGAGRIDVFNSSYELQPAASFPFADPTIPNTSGNRYSPYNIQAIGGSLYVTYEKVGVVTGDGEALGNGYVRKFDMNGVRDPTFAIDNGPLNAPWGIALAPPTFGRYGGSLLIGNSGRFSPGSINAFDPATGAFRGALQDEGGKSIVIEKLWGIVFGNGADGGDPDTLYFTAGLYLRANGLFGSLKPTTATATSLVQFSSSHYIIDESSGSIQVTVTRDGDVSGSATVNYATYSLLTDAHPKNDYVPAIGTLTFAPGETSKTFRVLLVDDKHYDSQTLRLALSNPTGAGLGSVNQSLIAIMDNDTRGAASNPIDDTPFFVRQHYLDFLGREADTGGFNAWVNVLAGCASGNTACDRVTVSRSFFESPEFQSRGYFIIRAYIAAYGRNPLYGEFVGELNRLNGATAEESNALRAGFAGAFATRNEFIATLGALTNEQYVDRLIANTGLAFPNRGALVASLNAAQKTRAQVLQEIVDSPLFVNHTPTFNRAYVLTQYFGYLGRNPDQAGYDMWINYLTANPGDFRTMVNGFVNSVEYRLRFGAA
ncbi:MAG TPA: TIGR03118 family protein [Pyrinomonadaceae bacterium]|nr:TIGR03118 family protein [Pyrinomonadaceae bacterium]